MRQCGMGFLGCHGANPDTIKAFLPHRDGSNLDWTERSKLDTQTFGAVALTECADLYIGRSVR